MAQIYGDRWEVIKTHASGGQSEVFLVNDIRGEYAAPCVLKRIRNPERRERFISEVNACKKLNHPHIIKLIDHSALDMPTKNEKMYLVLPFAAAGHLGKRAGMYKDSIDSTLTVAKSLADALNYAHTQGVIHRDMKPENVLFTDQDQNCLICDFGICLIRGTERVTEDDEIVGPRGFIAPELEDCGQLDVDPAADIYELGKLIYYMISGGVVLPRERLREKQYDIFESRGRRNQLLGLLLDRMICDHDSRIRSMKEVMDEIERIITWDQQTTTVISKRSSELLSDIIADETKRKTTREHNQMVEDRRKQNSDAYLASIEDWLAERFLDISKEFEQEGISSSQVITIPEPETLRIQLGGSKYLEGMWVRAIEFRFIEGPFTRSHVLYFVIYCEREVRFIVGNNIPTAEGDDPIIYFVPFYVRGDNLDWRGYLTRTEKIREGKNSLDSYVRKTFVGEGYTLLLKTNTAAWPANSSDYETVINEAVEVFLEYIRKGANTLGG